MQLVITGLLFDCRAAFENDVAKLTALLQDTAPEQRSLLDLHGNNVSTAVSLQHAAATTQQLDAASAAIISAAAPVGQLGSSICVAAVNWHTVSRMLLLCWPQQHTPQV